jgi:pilus assembly protein CpaC
MNMKRLLVAGYLGAVLASTALTPVSAEVLRVMQGQATEALSVPMNRAVVVESDAPFSDVSIANSNIADISTLSDRAIYVLGKAPGRTTLTLLSPDGQLISNVDVHVTPDIAEFKERLRQILPGEKIEVRTANDGIVLSGQVSSTAKLDRALDLANRYAPERVSNLMVVGGTQQVMLKVRFAEMNRSVSKNFSSSVALGDGIQVAAESGTFLSAANSLGGATIVPRGNTTGAIRMGGSIGGLEFAVLLEALESKGMVRTLAEPNLTALSGQEAKFLAGGEFPVPGESDGGGLTVSYKPFGVELTFTPVVVDEDIINLSINAAVSSLDTSTGIVDSGGRAIPAFKRRETSTTVDMRDGDSFAIAGLLQDDFRNANSQLPWVGDLPILGALFRSSEYQRAQTELVVIVTPHLVTPVAGEALALPTDRVRIPTERELFLFGSVAGTHNDGAAGEVARQDFSSSYGYVME